MTTDPRVHAAELAKENEKLLRRIAREESLREAAEAKAAAVAAACRCAHLEQQIRSASMAHTAVVADLEGRLSASSHKQASSAATIAKLSEELAKLRQINPKTIDDMERVPRGIWAAALAMQASMSVSRIAPFLFQMMYEPESCSVRVAEACGLLRGGVTIEVGQCSISMLPEMTIIEVNGKRGGEQMIDIANRIDAAIKVGRDFGPPSTWPGRLFAGNAIMDDVPVVTKSLAIADILIDVCRCAGIDADVKHGEVLVDVARKEEVWMKILTSLAEASNVGIGDLAVVRLRLPEEESYAVVARYTVDLVSPSAKSDKTVEDQYKRLEASGCNGAIKKTRHIIRYMREHYGDK